MKDILAKHGGASDAVRRCIKRHDLPLRPSGRRPWRKFSDEEVAEMYVMWEGGESQTAIARCFDTTQMIVSRLLSAAGYVLEHRPRVQVGEKHGSWKGGRTVTTGGYVWIKVQRDNPMAAMRNRMGYVPEHRLVMAHNLGRPLTDYETVHHVNGDAADNRPENLQLRHGKHGKGVAMVCADCGSHNLVARSIQD